MVLLLLNISLVLVCLAMRTVTIVDLLQSLSSSDGSGVSIAHKANVDTRDGLRLILIGVFIDDVHILVVGVLGCL